MQRYFVPANQMTASTVTILGDDVKHISKVMRMSSGNEVICSDNKERVALCTITEVNDASIELTITKWLKDRTELPIAVTVAQGLPKHDKLEMIVQKGTELGADQFIPFQAARSIVQWDHKKAKKKTQRLQKIIKEAAEQSHRDRMPECIEPVMLDHLISIGKEYSIKLIAYEEQAKLDETTQFKRLLNNATSNDRVLVVVGPEGGLTDKEVSQLQGAGFVSCGLGPRILRTETASLYVLSAFSYQFELSR